MEVNINSRFKDAPWYEQCTKESIVVVGQGGIASNAMYCLAKTVPCTYYTVDQDVVNEINIGTQFFNRNQIGKYKVEAVKETMSIQTLAKIFTFNKMYSNEYTPIMITGLDNMAARKQVFTEWRSQSDRELLLCARLRASYYEIFVVTPGKEEEYEKTLFDDSEVSEGPCTFKQTAYFGMLIGARITHILVNYLTNKYMGEEVCNIPWRVSEMGEAFTFETT